MAQAPVLEAFLLKREQKGLQTYGETLDTAKDYDWKQMILEELGDGLMYMTKYAEIHGPEAVLSEASLLIMLMASLERSLYGKDEKPDTVRDGDSGSEGGDRGPRIIISR